MLAYSTISHIGFILFGLMSASLNGVASAMFYVVSYVLMTLAGFGIILLLSRKGFEAEQLDDLKGLNQRSPWHAFLMLIVMFSMAGVPPTLGFYAKFTVLQAALQAGYLWLVVFAVLMAVIGAFYYLRVIKLMYFDDAVDQHAVEAPMDMRIILGVNALALLVLGIMPQKLMELCIYAITRSFS
jgi:NADH-quinone oxidoreductase subunit N